MIPARTTVGCMACGATLDLVNALVLRIGARDGQHYVFCNEACHQVYRARMKICPWCGRPNHHQIRRCACGHDPRCKKEYCRCEACFAARPR